MSTRRRTVAALGGVLLAAAAYLALWPVPIEPVRWDAPPDPGYTGPFAKNSRLTNTEKLPIAPHSGPEDIAFDVQGRLYASTHEGLIIRMTADGSRIQPWADTGGRPLGIDFHPSGNLIVADAYRGLLSIDRSGKVSVLADTVGDTKIRYADDVDVAPDGKIYFTDASTRFAAKASGGTLEASLLDLIEHRLTGRVLVHDPNTQKTTVLAKGFSFANGIAVAPDQQSVVVNETGAYRTWRIYIAGARSGSREVLIEHLPAFPDNVSTGQDGRFWIALVSPRNPLLDSLGDRPFLRKVVQRLPSFLRPDAKHYGHVIAVDAQGNVVADLQDPSGSYPMNTTAIETDDHLYIGSLIAPAITRVRKDAIGL